MYENNFEKQVREKMDQLGFDPSDTVWASVDKEINKEKKRRRPLFWLLFFPGLLLTGGTFYFIATKNNPNTRATIQKQGEINKKRSDQSLSKAGIPGEVNKKEDEDIKKSLSRSSQIAKTELKRAHANKSKPLMPGKEKIPSQVAADIDKRRGDKPLQNPIAESSDDIVIDNYSNKTIKTESGNMDKSGLDSSAGKNINALSENKSSKPDSVASSKSVKAKNEKPKSQHWKIGFTGGAGISNINQSLFKSVNANDPYYNLNTPAYTPNAPSTNNSSGGSTNYVSSEISPGFSFTAGAFVSRNLSTRISISAGIDYHYYSVGKKLDSVSSANSYYPNLNSQGSANQYHLIELPLSVNFQLNKSQQMPFIWELGLSPGYMVSSNAFQKTQFYNKIQLNGTTALMFGFPLHNNELQVGPLLQYGLTGLLKSGAANPGHLFYGGLKISFIPGKK
jgi:hypothetical protein